LRWNAVCIDCHPRDLEAVVAFYTQLLGLHVGDEDGRWASLRDPSGGMSLNVQAEHWYVSPVWPEAVPAQAKMMHFEIEVDDVESAAAHAVALGAREADPQPPDRDQHTLRVMLDPAGHPFCLWS
jgi:catechol 2,3-dioxygenase-like lactoylglutathione lyase family enzyme